MESLKDKLTFIYDEAIEELQDLHVDMAFGHSTENYNPQIIFNALERAKKIEELVGLKNELIELQNNYIKYQYQDFLHTTEMKELIALKKNEINQLEEELK